MACYMCSRNPRCHQHMNSLHCDGHPYSDVPADSGDLENEPSAPTLSLGNRILWLTESHAASGIVKWIGRIPSISNDWTAGIEFDKVMPGGGNGCFRGRQYFQSRLGHAVFLPVADVIKVDDPENGVERTSFFGRIQDSCSNFAQRRKRDSTFGHFKQDHCVNCGNSEFANYSHYCNHAPVYDRITSRRSLCFDDHPYEMYTACVPCNATPKVVNHFHASNAQKQMMKKHMTTCTVDDPKISLNMPVRKDYPDEDATDLNVMRKDSFFSHRPSLSLITGFKEWVTCLMMGTNRRKKKSNVIFKDRKSITSIFIAQKTQSITGKRLSSFADYASVDFKQKAQDRLAASSQNYDKRPEEETKKEIHKKSKYKKKRPAPLPPIQCTENAIGHINSSIARSVNANKDLKNQDCKDRGGPHFKIVRTSSIRIQSIPQKQKRRRKKRRAPPPPPITSGSVSDNLVHKPSFASTSSSGDRSHNRKDRKLRPSKIMPEKVEKSHSNSKPKIKHKVLYRQMQNFSAQGDDNDSGEESSSEDSKAPSEPVSFTEEDSDEDKYGLVKYGIIKKMSSKDSSLDLPSTSNFIQFSNDNSDVCLKISIQKTETNVVTVEEVSAPHTTTHYTIEEDSSSEYSDAPAPNLPLKAITNTEDSKQLSTDTSSLSTVEEATDKSKTIFEELQMKPPVKGSVKDFVQAFNMLANKNNGCVVDRKSNAFSNPKEQRCSNVDKCSETLNRVYESQSFPTNWEYQNKAANLIYASNQFLLPIAEESYNEASEHDGNVDDSKSSISKSTCAQSKTKTRSTDNNSSGKKCSHCSELHVQPVSSSETPKNFKKRTTPVHKKDKQVHENWKPLPKSEFSPQASIAALSSLLPQEKLENPPNNSAKQNAKLDQPIMVGLYIEDKSSHRGPIPLLITPTMPLKKLKKQIEDEYSFPRHQQCWILGESFAVADDATLASYGVTEPGCPVLLYVMAQDSKSQSLPSRSKMQLKSRQDDDSSSNEDEAAESRLKSKSNLKLGKNENANANKSAASLLGAVPKADKKQAKAPPPRIAQHKQQVDGKTRKPKSLFHKVWEAEFEKKADYHTLLALDDVDLVSNNEKFECPVCFLDVEPGEGAVLQDCLHSFCRDCLGGAIQFSETAAIKCPFRNDEYSCDSHLQEREVKSLVSPEIYERHLQRSMALAESQAQDSFHCKTPDCPGWCLFEDNVNTFLCPVCKHTNCLTCAAIHEGKNCRQYQDDVAFRCDSSEEARKTKEYLQNMVDNGEAMRCPQCQVILMKKWGCDWLKCSMCHTEVCWVTKGPRWGPGGRGDTSGGCKCMVDGARCHPKCSYCH